MFKSEKETLVASLRETLSKTEFIAVTKNSGITVSDATQLRAKIRDLGDAGYKIAKNTLMKLAVQGTNFEPLVDTFVGPTGVAYSADPVSLAKVLVEFTKSNEKLTILAGLLNGRLLSDREIKDLSNMPSLPELMAQIVGFINGAASALKKQIEAPAMALHGVIDQISKMENK